jgi:molybdopterin converting factor small subunit
MVTQRTVSVKLEFFGTIAKLTGIKSEELKADEDFTVCLEQVARRIKELTRGKVLYSILYNGSAVSALDSPPKPVKEGDVFTVVPVILGG